MEANRSPELPAALQDAYEQTRHSLIQALKDWSDTASWQTFFDRYKGLIYGVALKAGLRADEAQEVLQETVINVARNIGEFQTGPERGSFKAWLMKTTHWRIVDQFRKRHRSAAERTTAQDPEDRSALLERIPGEPQFDTLWESEWQQHLFAQGLQVARRKADPRQYQMFDLHVLKEWKAAEVAERFGVTEQQVYAAKYRVNKILEEELRKARDREP